MKFPPLLFGLLALASCRTAPPPLLPPRPAPRPGPAPTAVPFAVPAVVPPALPSPDARLQQQRQMIEALISQNDALVAKLAAATPPPPPPPTAALVPVVTPPPPAAGHEPPRAVVAANPPPPAPVPPLPAAAPPVFLAPNAEGVIDLTVVAPAGDEPVNPFAVRHRSGETAREVTLKLNGILGGPTPAALVNGRVLQVGEAVESFTLERCEADAAIFRRGAHWLRLPINAQPIRLLCPL